VRKIYYKQASRKPPFSWGQKLLRYCLGIVMAMIKVSVFLSREYEWAASSTGLTERAIGKANESSRELKVLATSSLFLPCCARQHKRLGWKPPSTGP